MTNSWAINGNSCFLLFEHKLPQIIHKFATNEIEFEVMR